MKKSSSLVRSPKKLAIGRPRVLSDDQLATSQGGSNPPPPKKDPNGFTY
jgi:hypothetical protein